MERYFPLFFVKMENGMERNGMEWNGMEWNAVLPTSASHHPTPPHTVVVCAHIVVVRVVGGDP